MPDLIILSNDSPEIAYLCRRDKRLAKLISMVGPLSFSTEDRDPYAFMVHEIIEQMLSIKAGQQIYGRLEALCGGTVSINTVEMLTDDQIRSTGTSTAKVQYIRNITEAAKQGILDIDEAQNLSDVEIIKRLTSIRGIGKWTAKMYLMFVLNRPDVLPLEDGAFLQVYRWLYKTTDCSPRSVEKRCEKWRPYQSTASRYFYRALDTGLIKTEFHLYKE